ncbi:MAG: hypothetical protein LBC78_03610 [Oscillospiraceae bacterium]|jgi:hypothetical protein|nr:hypothetical protein [Oscillospiraceae bacterium]
MRRFIKPTLAASLAVLAAVSLGGCLPWHPGTPDEYMVPEGHYRLVADFSNGVLPANTEGIPRTPSKFLHKPITCEYYDPATKNYVYADEAIHGAVMEMAGYLSEWTGLDFTLNGVTSAPDGVLIDWSKQSTLLAGLGDREMKAEFSFSDGVSLNWFMMDSLKSTVESNLPVVSFVYYCSEGAPLEFINPEDMADQGLRSLSADEQYWGSAYYVSEGE